MKLNPNEKVLRPVHPNVGLAVEYRMLLLRMIDAMHRSIEYWLSASYKQNEPAMAQDATPAAELRKAIRKLTRRWTKNWNDAADELAKYFSKSVHKRTDAQLKAILKKHGISVEWRMTDNMRDVLHATVNQNVSLIKSIPQQYLHKVEGLVMRSVQTGRDLGQLTKDLQKEFQITRKRASFIARDQNNKATSALTRVRQTELGIEKAIWLHSHAGKKFRKTHIANDGKTYDVNKGWFDPDPKVKRRIWPGELINCRCISKSIVAGFS